MTASHDHTESGENTRPDREPAREQAVPTQPFKDREYRLELSDAERAGMAREIRRYGEIRQDIALGMADPGPESSFELSTDPTCYYGP